MVEYIQYIDRTTGQDCTEKVYGERFVRMVYGQSGPISKSLQFLACRNAAFSKLMAGITNLSCTRHRIEPFVQAYDVDTSEFLKPVDAFTSFNDFFCRELKPEARPVATSAAVVPADGRYYFYHNISQAAPFDVKGSSFDLAKFLQNDALAERYRDAIWFWGVYALQTTIDFIFPLTARLQKAL